MVKSDPVSSATHPEDRVLGLRFAGPLALLLAPHVPRRVRIVARASTWPWGPQQNANLFLKRNP